MCLQTGKKSLGKDMRKFMPRPGIEPRFAGSSVRPWNVSRLQPRHEWLSGGASATSR